MQSRCSTWWFSILNILHCLFEQMLHRNWTQYPVPIWPVCLPSFMHTHLIYVHHRYYYLTALIPSPLATYWMVAQRRTHNTRLYAIEQWVHLKNIYTHITQTQTLMKDNAFTTFFVFTNKWIWCTVCSFDLNVLNSIYEFVRMIKSAPLDLNAT